MIERRLALGLLPGLRCGPPWRLPLALATAALVLAGCSGAHTTPVADEHQGGSNGAPTAGKLFGDQGLVFGVGKSNTGADSGGGALGVNAYLWRGALDTLSFMPLASADPFGGVIITDWYQPPSSPGERFKATAYILGRQLRADGVRVAMFRQVQQGGQWTDAPINQTTTAEIENKVLARARELRSQTVSNQ